MIGGFADEHFFLSNFSQDPTPWVAGATIAEYPTAEHAFQASKTFNVSERRRVFKAATPSAAKKAGRSLALRADWEAVKDDVMLGVLFSKFTFDIPIRQALLTTAPHELIEGNTWHDNYWGDCICGREACVGEGKNMLGILLMRVRTALL